MMKRLFLAAALALHVAGAVLVLGLGLVADAGRLLAGTLVLVAVLAVARVVAGVSVGRHGLLSAFDPGIGPVGTMLANPPLGPRRGCVRTGITAFSAMTFSAVNGPVR